MLDPPTRAALDALFCPRRVALVGASDRPGSAGAVLWENLSGFTGEVLPVTSSGRPVGGVPSYRSLLDVPGALDLAVVVVPAAEVPGIVREAGQKGIPVCVVISSGFAETGSGGVQLQRDLIEAATSAGVRIIGPNCLGVQHAGASLNASLAPSAPQRSARPGTISLVTQSGAYGMALHTLAVDDDVAFDKVLATGNKLDVTDTELLEYLGSAGSGPICFFLESLPDGRAFVDCARKIALRRPVIVCRTGSSTAGRRAAGSHTAGLAGRPRIWSAAFAEAGIIETGTGLAMLDVARALETQAPPRGPRVGVVTNSGGVGVEITDLLAQEGLAVPLLSEAVRIRLTALLPAHGSAGNPVDLTTAWQRFPELYSASIDLLARSGEVDSIVAVLLQRSASVEVAESVAAAVRRLRTDGVDIPVYVCWVGARASLAHARPLRDGGVPVLEWPERTARAVGHATRHGAFARGPRVVSPAAEHSPPDTGGWLDAAQSAGLLSAYDVPLVRWSTCTDVESAIVEATTFDPPVVLKACHPDLLHKSDQDGVVLGLDGDLQVRAAAERLLGLRDGATLLLQQEAMGTEVIVGGVRDAEFGPVVMVGTGGVDVDSTDDVQLALAPISEDRAKEMIRRLRGASALLGRRQGGADIDAIARVVHLLGQLMLDRPDVQEVDLNPLLARPDGCTVVDWRIRVGASSPQDEQATGGGEPRP